MRRPHNLYWVVPLVTFALCVLMADATWITTLVGLLGLWTADGKPQYEPADASVVFISTIGARYKTFFIIFASLSAGFYILTTLLERYLRHARKIPGPVRRRQTWYDIASVLFAIIGAAALVLLSVFDSQNYGTVHWSMTAIFVASVAISVLFQLLQIYSLARSHDDPLWQLRAMAVVKTIILGVAVLNTIVFISLYARCRGDAPGLSTSTYCNRVTVGAAVCEWIDAFLLSLFFLSYIVDLYQYPSVNRDEGLDGSGRVVQDPELAARKGHDDMAFAANGTTANNTPYPSVGTAGGAKYSPDHASLSQPPMQEAPAPGMRHLEEGGRAY